VARPVELTVKADAGFRRKVAAASSCPPRDPGQAVIDRIREQCSLPGVELLIEIGDAVETEPANLAGRDAVL
jgi:hypothetical protein